MSDLTRPPFELLRLYLLVHGQTVEHEFGFGDLLGFYGLWVLLNLHLKFSDFLFDVRVLFQLLDCDAFALFVLEHSSKHVKKQGVYTADLLRYVNAVLLLNLLQNS